MKDNKKTFGYYTGQILGAILFGCIAVCLAAIAIALTAKFVFWIF